jgi:hypothetical protein
VTDQWVRNPDQQALAEAQAIVDAQARPDIVVRHYPGVPEAAVADFKADAGQMIPTGWHPVSVVYAAIVLDPATVLALGTLAVAARVPGGSLVVTYRYQQPGGASDTG